MGIDKPPVRLSKLDEERFGIRTAVARGVTSATLPSVLEFCRENDVKFLIARSLCTELSAAQEMERQGFILMDTLVYYVRELGQGPLPTDTGTALIRFRRPGDEDTVRAVAGEVFGAYQGHYHADKRLDQAQCDEVYQSWVYNSCVSREFADAVMIAELKGTIVGFGTVRMNSPQECEGVLAGVSPSAQGHGIYRSFIIRSLEWCHEQKAQRMVVSTQITNVAVQKVWARLSFELSSSYYTYHKWFD